MVRMGVIMGRQLHNWPVIYFTVSEVVGVRKMCKQKYVSIPHVLTISPQ